MTEILKEKWMKGVAVTTTTLAVMTAIAAARGGTCAAKTQLLTALESSQWAYYQSKGVKQNLAESEKSIFEVEILGAANPGQRAAYAKKIEFATQESARYLKQKEDIRKGAEGTAQSNKLLQRKGNFFSAAVVFFQIAIMLSSVAALLGKKSMWIVGLFFGVIAIVLLGYGLFLQPLLF